MGASSSHTGASSGRAVGGRALDVQLFERLTEARGASTDVARARLLGVDRMTIYRLRWRRVAPSMETATRVAAVLEVTIDQLFPVAS